MVLLLQGARVRSLVAELRSLMSHRVAKKIAGGWGEMGYTLHSKRQWGDRGSWYPFGPKIIWFSINQNLKVSPPPVLSYILNLSLHICTLIASALLQTEPMPPSWSGQHGHQHARHWISVSLANPAGRDISLPKSIYQSRKISHWSCLDYIPTPEPVTTARVTGCMSSQAQDNGAPASWLTAPVRPHGRGEGEASKDTGLPGWWTQHLLCASCGLLLIPNRHLQKWKEGAEHRGVQTVTLEPTFLEGGQISDTCH